ncbi:hypothetical protein D9M68_472450 [compost metagenome]
MHSGRDIRRYYGACHRASLAGAVQAKLAARWAQKAARRAFDCSPAPLPSCAECLVHNEFLAPLAGTPVILSGYASNALGLGGRQLGLPVRRERTGVCGGLGLLLHSARVLNCLQSSPLLFPLDVVGRDISCEILGGALCQHFPTQ